MKKRRELDALVNSKSPKNGRHELLRNESDSSEEVEEFSVPQKSVVRKYVFLIINCGNTTFGTRYPVSVISLTNHHVGTASCTWRAHSVFRITCHIDRHGWTMMASDVRWLTIRMLNRVYFIKSWYPTAISGCKLDIRFWRLTAYLIFPHTRRSSVQVDPSPSVFCQIPSLNLCGGLENTVFTENTNDHSVLLIVDSVLLGR